MVIALVAGVGRVSCAQVLRNLRLPPTGLTYRKTENVKITHENIPENVKS